MYLLFLLQTFLLSAPWQPLRGSRDQGSSPSLLPCLCQGKWPLMPDQGAFFFLMWFPEAGVPKVQKSGPLHQQPCTATLKMCM